MTEIPEAAIRAAPIIRQQIAAEIREGRGLCLQRAFIDEFLSGMDFAAQIAERSGE